MSDAAVLVPLYIYPFEGAWQPLYDAIAAHPRTQFLVVVNPGNGPGPASLPDANYCREIPKLRSQPNVAVFGYVHVQWAQRELDTVLQDVEIYEAWPNHEPSMRVDGIFVDETPTAADARTVAFLGSLTSLVHRIWPNHPSAYPTSGDSPAAPTPGPDPGTGIMTGTALPTIIHNPGCMPAAALLELTDLCVVFEDTWDVFLERVQEGVFSDDYRERVAAAAADDDHDGNGTGATTPLPALPGSPDVSSDAAAEAADETHAPDQAHEQAQPELLVADEQKQDQGLQSVSQLNGSLLPEEEEGEGKQEKQKGGEVTIQNHGPGEEDGQEEEGQEEEEKGVLPDRSKRCVVVHSVPLPPLVAELVADNEGGDDDDDGGSASGGLQQQPDDGATMPVIDSSRAAKVKEVIAAARQVAGTVFVTELSECYYERFGPGWREWAGGVGAED